MDEILLYDLKFVWNHLKFILNKNLFEYHRLLDVIELLLDQPTYIFIYER